MPVHPHTLYGHVRQEGPHHAGRVREMVMSEMLKLFSSSKVRGTLYFFGK